MYILVTTLVAVLSVIASTAAVVNIGVCSGFNGGTFQCQPPCTVLSVTGWQIVDTPGTQCVYLLHNNPNFDISVCNHPNDGGVCTDVGKDLAFTTFSGNDNFRTPGTASILVLGGGTQVVAKVLLSMLSSRHSDCRCWLCIKTISHSDQLHPQLQQHHCNAETVDGK